MIEADRGGLGRNGADGMRRVMIATAALLGCAAALPPSAPARPIPPLSAVAPPAAHDVHLSYARAAIDGRTVAVRIRMFTDDLEAALAKRHGIEGFKLATAETAVADSLFTIYFNERFGVTADGKRLAGRVVKSGEENDMWWYLVQYEAPAPVRKLSLRHEVLFELFRDQRNLLKLLHVPSSSELAYYFVVGDAERNDITF